MNPLNLLRDANLQINHFKQGFSLNEPGTLKL